MADCARRAIKVKLRPNYHRRRMAESSDARAGPPNLCGNWGWSAVHFVCDRIRDEVRPDEVELAEPGFRPNSRDLALSGDRPTAGRCGGPPLGCQGCQECQASNRDQDPWRGT